MWMGRGKNAPEHSGRRKRDMPSGSGAIHENRSHYGYNGSIYFFRKFYHSVPWCGRDIYGNNSKRIFWKLGGQRESDFAGGSQTGENGNAGQGEDV